MLYIICNKGKCELFYGGTYSFFIILSLSIISTISSLKIFIFISKEKKSSFLEDEAKLKMEEQEYKLKLKNDKMNNKYKNYKKYLAIFVFVLFILLSFASTIEVRHEFYMPNSDEIKAMKVVEFGTN